MSEVGWTRFSAEAVLLDSKIRKLHKRADATAAIEAIEQALERAYTDGPSNLTFVQFEALAHPTQE